MLRRLFDAFFGCSHDNITFPMSKKGGGGTHVTCLTCGQEFNYDFKDMKIGKPIIGETHA